jgi:chloramphenicol 3-O-phosphotransferase
MLGSLFKRGKQQKQESENPPKDIGVDALLAQTAQELRNLGIVYAMASIATPDPKGVLALRSASLRLEKVARQFEMSAKLFSDNQNDEE